MFGAYEAFVEASTSAARPSYVRVGRQAVTWGEGRLVGEADWSPVGRSLDAIRAHASLGAWDFELLGAVLDTPHPAGVALGDTSGPAALGTELAGAQVALAIDPLLKIELSALARVARSQSTLTDPSRFARARAEGELYLGSLRVFGEARGWRYAVEGAYEIGNAHLLADAAIAAYAGSAYVEKKLDTIVLSPALRLGVDYASGDDGNGGTYRQFDPLLPDVHLHYGAMDALAWSNTAQAHARLAIIPWTDTRAAVEYRYARLVKTGGEWLGSYLTVIGGGGSASAELGHEIDASFTYRPWPALELAAGYSLFVVGDGARAALVAAGRGALGADGSVTASSLAHYGYLQVAVVVP
jgi:hypothetical protein